jgi:Zn ribbon nucleic-acid-binding protein
MSKNAEGIDLPFNPNPSPPASNKFNTNATTTVPVDGKRKRVKSLLTSMPIGGNCPVCQTSDYVSLPLNLKVITVACSSCGVVYIKGIISRRDDESDS